MKKRGKRDLTGGEWPPVSFDASGRRRDASGSRAFEKRSVASLPFFTSVVGACLLPRRVASWTDMLNFHDPIDDPLETGFGPKKCKRALHVHIDHPLEML
jgi:hypothetical protein